MTGHRHRPRRAPAPCVCGCLRSWHRLLHDQFGACFRRPTTAPPCGCPTYTPQET